MKQDLEKQKECIPYCGCIPSDDICKGVVVKRKPINEVIDVLEYHPSVRKVLRLLKKQFEIMSVYHSEPLYENEYVFDEELGFVGRSHKIRGKGYFVEIEYREHGSDELLDLFKLRIERDKFYFK